MSSISSLTLTNFRCYHAEKLVDIANGLIVLFGANGAGKTNVLEAVSLLSPGRGLRKAKVGEIQNNVQEAPWAVAAKIGDSKIGTGRDPQSNKRIIRINGETAKSQAALGDYMNCLWLTPQMDGLFLGGAGDRRRFLDRMIYAFDPAHAGRVTRYDNVMRQRSKVLQDERGADPLWLDALEQQMSETGVAIAVSRLEFVGALQAACFEFKTPHFPHATLSLQGTLEDALDGTPALAVEDDFKARLKQSRPQDQYTGGASVGPHKTDMIVHYADKNMLADQCSTGEQKSLLIGMVLAHAMLIKTRNGASPVILLDEVAAHLDENRRAALYDLLQDTGGQVWLTGTDRTLFQSIEGSAQFFEVAESRVIAN